MAEIVLNELLAQRFELGAVRGQIGHEIMLEARPGADASDRCRRFTRGGCGCLLILTTGLFCIWVCLWQHRRLPDRLGHIGPILLQHIGSMDHDLGQIVVGEQDKHFAVMRPERVGEVCRDRFNIRPAPTCIFNSQPVSVFGSP